MQRLAKALKLKWNNKTYPLLKRGIGSVYVTLDYIRNGLVKLRGTYIAMHNPTIYLVLPDHVVHCIYMLIWIYTQRL